MPETTTALRHFLFFLALCMLVGLSGRGQAAPGRLIATGWDSPTAAEFRKNVMEFEKSPFDSATIFPTIKLADGKTVSNGYVFSREKWADNACAAMTADLRATQSRIKTHSFLFCYANPGDVDWFDDSGWTQITDHWRQLARAAKISGLRGLLFDAEPYTAGFQQFNDTRQAGAARHTFAEYAAKARERGRQVMRVVTSEYPDITLFSYRLLSDLLPLVGRDGDARQALSGNTYALLPAFVDGWLDVAPPTVTLVEGNEDIGYRANSSAAFDRAFARLRTEIPALLDPVHVGKYRSQVLISHGLYLDAYTNPPGNPWYIDPLGGTPAARLESNTAAALHAADSGYVWLYGETGRWWPTRVGGTAYPLWQDKFKGCETALLRAKDPVGAVRALLVSAPPASNLLLNGDFVRHAESGLPMEWWNWQEDNSHGKPTLENGAVCWSGAAQAVFGQNVAVKPGSRYAMRALLQHRGRGSALISIGWKDAQGHWCSQGDNVLLWPSATPDAQGWREAAGIIAAPPGSATMIVMFAVNAQSSSEDRAQCRQIQCVEMH